MQQCDNCIWNGECDLCEQERECEYFTSLDDSEEQYYIQDLKMRHEYYMEFAQEMQS